MVVIIKSLYLHFFKEEDYSLLEDDSNTLMKKLTHQTLSREKSYRKSTLKTMI